MDERGASPFLGCSLGTTRVGAGTKIKGMTPEAVLKIRDDFNERTYHSPQDEFQHDWDFSGFATLARFALDLADDVANADRLPTWNAGDEYRPLREKQGVK